MFINATGFYVPETRIGNCHFARMYGVDESWFVQRTGIFTRSRAESDETVDMMAVNAVWNALSCLPYDVRSVDLIVSAAYTPDDTIFTTAHKVQSEFDIRDAKALHISSACSSFVNALEIVEGYFSMGKASTALIVSSEKNSSYCNESDYNSGHLWGDAAVAFFVSSERFSCREPEICDIYTRGLGFMSKAFDAVNLRPRHGGLTMNNGRDVFQKACACISENVYYILQKNGLKPDSLSFLITHQANIRIIKAVARQLGVPDEKCLHNINEFGNTGSASVALVYAQNNSIFTNGDLIVMSVFGGGYSTGACLIRC